MRALITGGAGFVGSHLSDLLLADGHDVSIIDDLSTGSIDNIQHLKSHPRFSYRIDTIENEPLLAELIDGARRRLPPRRRGGGEEDRRGAGPHHRGQRPRHRGRAAARQQEEEAGAHRLDVGGLRQEHGRAVQRGRRPRDGADAEAPLGLRLQQGHRRVPGARVLEGEEAAGRHRPAVQHGRAAADRAIRHGRARRSSGRRWPGNRSRSSATAPSRAASPTSATSSARWSGWCRSRRPIGQVVNVGNSGEITMRQLAELVKAKTGSASPIVLVPYDQAYEAGFEDMPRRVPDLGKIAALIGYQPDRRPRRDPRPRDRARPQQVGGGGVPAHPSLAPARPAHHRALNVGGPAIHATLLAERLDPSRYDSLLVAGTEDAAEGSYLDLHRPRDPQPGAPARARAGDPRFPGRPGAAGAGAADRARPPARRPHAHGEGGHAGPSRRRSSDACRSSCTPTTGTCCRGTSRRRRSGCSSASSACSPAPPASSSRSVPRVRDDLLALGVGTASRFSVVPLGLDLARFEQQRPAARRAPPGARPRRRRAAGRHRRPARADQGPRGLPRRGARAGGAAGRTLASSSSATASGAPSLEQLAARARPRLARHLPRMARRPRSDLC